MIFFYENRHNWLIANANLKAWEVIKKTTNCTGMYDSQDSLPASAVLQAMAMEIHCSTGQGTADVMTNASAAFTVVITDRETAEMANQSCESFVGLFSQASRHSVREVGQELLVRLYEALQVAVTSGKLPGWINPQVYATMVAGIMDIAQDTVVDPQFSNVKRLRSWLSKFTRIFSCNKIRQDAVGSATRNYFPIQPIQSIEANLADVN